MSELRTNRIFQEMDFKSGIGGGNYTGKIQPPMIQAPIF